jgi:hypothetical protein
MKHPQTPDGRQPMRGGRHVTSSGPVSDTATSETAYWACLNCGDTVLEAAAPSHSCTHCWGPDWARAHLEDWPADALELKALADEHGSLRAAAPENVEV